MNWGSVEAEAEVTEWLLALPAKTFGHVRLYIDLLTVFRKTRQRDRAEIDRAWRAMRVCMTDHLEEVQ